MDLFSTFLVSFGLSTLGFSAFSPPPSEGPFLYRRTLSWTDGWTATECCSVSSLRTAMEALDLPRDLSWEAALDSRLRTFVILVRDGGPPEWAVLCSFDRIGSIWEVREIFGYGMNKTLRPEQDQHVSELVAHMRRDLGKEISGKARSISDPERRYAFLRAVVRQPVLAARVVPESDFAEVVLETAAVVAPERLEQIESARRPDPGLLSSDLVVQRVPISDRIHHILPAP